MQVSTTLLAYALLHYCAIFLNQARAKPESIMLERLPKVLLGISQKIPLLCLDSFLLCSIMLTVITAVSYVYTHN